MMHVTYGLMGLFVISLVVLLLYQAKKSQDKAFFDLQNTQTMRGVFALIIMLVHVPTAYSNIIQDMLGSFAYVGVTFFFMISGYGLRMKNDLSHFWQKRIPKLLIPCLVSNLFFQVSRMKEGGWTGLLYINRWVLWLIVCYAIYWVVYKFIKVPNRDIVIIIGIFVLSVAMYLLRIYDIMTETWPTEVWGFVFGILLAKYRNSFVDRMKSKWFIKEMLIMLATGILGIAYLRYKHILVWGDYFLKIILAVAILCVILVANVRIGIGNKLSCYLGNISYEIYLIHGRVYKMVDSCFCITNSGVFIIMSIIITIMIAMLTHWICVCILNRMQKKINR